MLQNIFLIAGLYILCSGLISWYQNFVFFNKCKKTKGKIISHYYQIDSNKNDQIRKPYPIFQYYHPVSEKEHTLRSNVSELMKEGQEIDIYYDPRDPIKPE